MSACAWKDFGEPHKKSYATGYFLSSLAIWTRGGHEQYHECAKKTEEIHSNGSSSRHNTNDSIPMSCALQRFSTSRLWHFEPSGKDPMSCSILCTYVFSIYAPLATHICTETICNCRLQSSKPVCSRKLWPWQHQIVASRLPG